MLQSNRTSNFALRIVAVISKCVLGISKNWGPQWYSPYCTYPQNGFDDSRRPLYQGTWSGLASLQLSYNTFWCSCSSFKFWSSQALKLWTKGVAPQHFVMRVSAYSWGYVEADVLRTFSIQQAFGSGSLPRILLRLLVVAARAVCTLPVGCFSEASQGFVQVASVL